MSHAANQYLIDINLTRQRLQLRQGDELLMDVLVSTAKNGPGEVANSHCTPRGWHTIRAKIGAGCEVNTIFVGRRRTGEIYTPALHQQYPKRDWILTRILWLSGLEPGCNRLGNVDTMRRYIYIHGTPECVEMGQPGSHGCIRMRNSELIQLFDIVPACTHVLIHE